MPKASPKRTPSNKPLKRASASIDAVVADIVRKLKRLGSKQIRDDMATRYGIRLPDPERAFGVRMNVMHKVAKQAKGKNAGANHQLALALWDTGWYEARTVAAFVDDPHLVTPTQMDRWAKDFDNWGICDTVCFHLFDRTPHAYRKVAQWNRRREEFVKRAAFALLASLALHDKPAPDEAFISLLPLLEKQAGDERNFVKKAVSWALRGIGRRNLDLNEAALAVAKRLAESAVATPRWIGKDALRDLAAPKLRTRLERRGTKVPRGI